MKPPLIVTSGRHHHPAARRLKERLPVARLALAEGRHETDSQREQTTDNQPAADISYTMVASFLPTAFLAGHPLIWIGAPAIPIRLLGPFLSNKWDEPPLIAVDHALQSVIPLLGLHHGGMALVGRINAALNHTPKQTEDHPSGAFILDTPPPGWILANRKDYTSWIARWRRGATIHGQDVPWLPSVMESPSLPTDNRKAKTDTLRVIGSAKKRQPERGVLHYIPQCLAIGAGCSRHAPGDEIIALAEKSLGSYDRRAVAGVFSVGQKMDEDAIHALAHHFGVPARFFSSADLNANSKNVPHPSPIVMRAVGTPSVAESAALLAAGPKGILEVGKQRSRHATIAIAMAMAPIDPTAHGIARGQLDIVGLGPGGRGQRSIEVEEILNNAQDIIGYAPYVDAVGPLVTKPELHRFAIGAEKQRARHALTLAATGRRVALVSSGDPSIYAMAGVLFEVLEQEAKPSWKKIAIHVRPGISALQSASAIVGAMIGHDFCAISLSDLLTDYGAIKKRLEAAAACDFIIALYNPISRTRRRPFIDALRILQTARDALTPVVIVHHAARPRQHVRMITLEELKPDMVDMHAIVIIGSSAARRFDGGNGRTWLYTPRSGKNTPSTRS